MENPMREGLSGPVRPHDRRRFPLLALLLACLLAFVSLERAGCAGDPKSRAGGGNRYDAERRAMVEEQLGRRDITDAKVLEVMGRVPRHLFVPEKERRWAYGDHPLPIGRGQTISQPYIVALMTQLARPAKGQRALDVGTGSGYQAAVLAELVDKVYSIEILCPLADEARSRLWSLGYANVEVRCGDGYAGWAERAPFDAIIVAAAAPRIPEPLVRQLAPGGRLVIPVGEIDQDLVVVEKNADGTVTRTGVLPVRFVPMTGEIRKR
jgi:protein-L-isoaspartate(D-aspartate) O-methyltransferase